LHLGAQIHQDVQDDAVMRVHHVWAVLGDVLELATGFERDLIAPIPADACGHEIDNLRCFRIGGGPAARHAHIVDEAKEDPADLLG
jgi:hypothetical protein